MSNLIIFDLDGVLVDSKGIHFDALNKALCDVDPKYQISVEDQSKTYEGIPTKTKLKILSENRGLDVELHDFVWKQKQKYTFEMMDNIQEDVELQDFLRLIKTYGIKTAIASNSIRETIVSFAEKLGIINYIDIIVSNEDVVHPKPFPEIYWKCMVQTKSVPSSTVIFEDSVVGKIGATDSGAFLIEIKNRKDLDLEKIKKAVKVLKSRKAKVGTKNINILIPMAGLGSRFHAAGYSFPKPLIDVNGNPMIKLVVDNIGIDGNYIFIVQKEHFEKYNLRETLEIIAPGCSIVQIDGTTEGAAVTSLFAKEYINNDSPLIIANSDQFVEWNSREFIYSSISSEVDGSIACFESSHPKWSYAKVNSHGFIEEVAEKKPISNYATVGIYYWKTGSDYVKYAEQMIEKNIRTNNEFYICPVYNEAISDGKKISKFDVEKMWGLGTPEDLDNYLNNYDRKN